MTTPLPTFLPAAQRARAEALWKDLEARTGVWRLAASWDWTGTWLRHYGAYVPHRFAAWPDADRPSAMALVSESRRRVGGFRLRTAHVGTAGEGVGESVHVEYNSLLAEEGAAESFAGALLAALRAERFDEVALDGFAAADLAPFVAADRELELRAEPAPIALLDAGDVVGALPSSVRRHIRRSERAFGPLEREWPESPERALEVLDELIELHQRRWAATGARGAFASPHFVGFHRDLIARLSPQGRVFVFRVAAPQGTIGCVYGFIERDRALFYQSGLQTFEDNKLKPGLVTHAACMQACHDRGYREYDFLAGDSRYKRELANTETQIFWAKARRESAKIVLLQAGRSLKTRLRLG